MHFRTIGATLAVLVAGGGFAQQTPVMKNDEDPTRITVEVTRVNMLFTVMDKKGRFVTNLNKEDFELLENKRAQSIQEFTAETDLPLRLGILIDTSNSVRDRFKFEQQAATAVDLHVDEAGQQQMTVQIVPLRIAHARVVMRDDGHDALAAHQHGESFARTVVAEYASVDQGNQRIHRHHTVSVTLRRCGGTSGS